MLETKKIESLAYNDTYFTINIYQECVGSFLDLRLTHRRCI